MDCAGGCNHFLAYNYGAVLAGERDAGRPDSMPNRWGWFSDERLVKFLHRINFQE
jgi:hypothetical protein